MWRSGKLPSLILIGVLSFGLIDGSHEDSSAEDCNVFLNFTAVGLKSLPDRFVDNKFITQIILDGNEISVVSSQAFSSVPSLSHLSLAKNKLTNLTLSPFSEIYNLETLILNDNCKKRTVIKYRSRTLYDEYDYRYQYSYRQTQEPYEETTYCSLQFDSHLRSLTHLFVEYNDIKIISFPDELITTDALLTLTHLSLSHNPVNMDQKTILGLNTYAPALTHLYLKYCEIAELNVSLLPTVTSLHLDGNNIQSICGKTCEGKSLRLDKAQELDTLSVSHNQISKIAIDSFDDAKNLLTLDLSHNSISEISKGTFDGLYLLQSLSLEYNNLVLLSAEDVFRNLIQLETLFIGGNDLSNIDSGLFTNMSTLRELMLNDTQISSIDSGMFANLTNLEVLSLASNELTQIPEGSMPTSGSLITLNLDNNKFTNTKDIGLVNVPNLLSVSLRQNPLTTMSAQWIVGIDSENLTLSLGNFPPSR